MAAVFGLAVGAHARGKEKNVLEEARLSFTERQDDLAHTQPPQPPQLDHGFHNNVVLECGNNRTPFTIENFESCVKQEMGLDLGDPVPGFIGYERRFREKQLAELFVKDEGATIKL